MKNFIYLLPAIAGIIATAAPSAEAQTSPIGESGDIKSYCIDFNWQPTGRRGRPFAKPGNWNGADPAAHVAWYKAVGANVIQTFCVASNGYAWYKNGFVPEQPGLKHDFLPEVVKLGHKEGMKVMGYFCISANPRWADGMMRHGFRGAAEIAATLDHMAAFANTTRAVPGGLFDLYLEATLGRAEVVAFMEVANPQALAAMRDRFRALLDSGLWTTRRNSVGALLEERA